MSFSASWLALREPYDHAARAAALTGKLRDFLAARAGGHLRFLDLACGLGSTFRYLAPRLGGAQHWTMVDNDEDLLASLARLPSQAKRTLDGQATVEAVRLDLAGELDSLPMHRVDVVTASALLDLVSGEWLDRLVTAVGATRPALLLALIYDGSMQWEPVLAEDRWVTDLFNRHQRTDKGFGPALGDTAAQAATRRLRAAGFSVTQAQSPWLLDTGDGAVQREVASGVAGAVSALLADVADVADGATRARRWLEQRVALVDAGRSSLRVGHTDLLALPLSAGG